MKIKITRSDGTVIELEGDAAQLQAVLPHVLPFPFVLNPATVTFPLAPVQPDGGTAVPAWNPDTIRY